MKRHILELLLNVLVDIWRALRKNEAKSLQQFTLELIARSNSRDLHAEHPDPFECEFQRGTNRYWHSRELTLRAIVLQKNGEETGTNRVL